jgi:ADP-heptose:LPS heptosyltransferase
MKWHQFISMTKEEIFMQPTITDIKKIGIFRALYLGDMLCIIPAVRAIRKAYPAAMISLIGLPWQRHFAKRFGHYFDEFIEFTGWPGLPEQEIDVPRILDFIETIRSKKFDLVFQMQGNGMITNSMVMLWGARYVCGLRRADGYNPDSQFFPVSEDTDHEIMRFLKLTEALHIPNQGYELEFPILESEIMNFAGMLTELSLPLKKYICLHPGARDVKRRWPVQNFSHVGNYLADKGYTIVLTGSVEETEILQALSDAIDFPTINLVEQFGQLGIGELAAFIQHSAMLISNDTGVSHIAAALQVPSVVIFSPHSSIERWAPLNLERHLAIPCEKAKDAEYVLYCVLNHLEKQKISESPVLLNQK